MDTIGGGHHHESSGTDLGDGRLSNGLARQDVYLHHLGEPITPTCQTLSNCSDADVLLVLQCSRPEPAPITHQLLQVERSSSLKINPDYYLSASHPL